MRVLVNGVRLFFDVEGAGLVPEGPTMREKPTILLLHGGPGFDHSIYKPAFSALADVAQVIFLDHRGNGRSDPGSEETWTLTQWSDDVREFCEVLGIARPIVFGASFGGTVALAYATRHPEHPAKLILASTEAVGGTYLERRVEMFERLGGPEVGALARRRFLEGRGNARSLGPPGLPTLHAHAARSQRHAAGSSPPGGHAVVHAAGRRRAHVQPAPGPLESTVSDARVGWGGGSDDAARVSGGYRRHAPGPSRPFRAVSGVWTCGDS